jgi:hypothetical protein
MFNIAKRSCQPSKTTGPLAWSVLAEGKQWAKVADEERLWVNTGAVSQHNVVAVGAAR